MVHAVTGWQLPTPHEPRFSQTSKQGQENQKKKVTFFSRHSCIPWCDNLLDLDTFDWSIAGKLAQSLIVLDNYWALFHWGKKDEEDCLNLRQPHTIPHIKLTWGQRCFNVSRLNAFGVSFQCSNPMHSSHSQASPDAKLVRQMSPAGKVKARFTGERFGSVAMQTNGQYFVIGKTCADPCEIQPWGVALKTGSMTLWQVDDREDDLL